MTETLRLDHRLRRMVGRDPAEPHRAATPIELLYDLTFVLAIGATTDETGHLVAEGHWAAALAGFAFAMFAVCWAWIQYSWFSSAFDTDDWFFRIATMVQMVGVLILTLGLPAVFESLDRGEPLDNGLVVTGYVVMRLAHVALWIRVAVSDERHRRTALVYIVTIALAQAGWVALVLARPPLAVTAALLVPLYLVEIAGPVIAERGRGATPWHAGHIAERYGLLVIIALGEVVLGTVTTISAVVAEHGWNADAVVLAFAGIALAFGLWWLYYITPAASVLRVRRSLRFVWGYGHLLVFASVAAIGAGLHVAAASIHGETTLPPAAVVLTIAVPVLVFELAIFALHSILLNAVDAFHVPLFIGSLLALAAAVVVALAGGSTTVALVLVVLSPVVTIVGYETVGHRHVAAALERITAGSPG